jgi:hypothetical protein
MVFSLSGQESRVPSAFGAERAGVPSAIVVNGEGYWATANLPGNLPGNLLFLSIV